MHKINQYDAIETTKIIEYKLPLTLNYSTQLTLPKITGFWVDISIQSLHLTVLLASYRQHTLRNTFDIRNARIHYSILYKSLCNVCV